MREATTKALPVRIVEERQRRRCPSARRAPAGLQQNARLFLREP